MSDKRGILWFPALASAAALVAGLAGIALCGDWKLLLAFPVGFALCEIAANIDFIETLRKNRADFDRINDRITNGKGSKFDSEKFISWFDCIGAALGAFVAMMMAFYLVDRFTAFRGDWLWVKACWSAGCAIVPWTCTYKDAAGRFRRWVHFASVFTLAAVVVFCVRYAEIALYCLTALIVVLFCFHHWRTNRKCGGKGEK